MKSNEFTAWRERLGYSQRTAADLLGVRLVTIRGYETFGLIPKNIELATITIEVVDYLAEETRQEMIANHQQRHLPGLCHLYYKLRSDGGLLSFLKEQYVRKPKPSGQQSNLMTSEEFREWRENLSLTPEEAADYLGISKITFLRYETNGNIPDSIKLACIALENIFFILKKELEHCYPNTTAHRLLFKHYWLSKLEKVGGLLSNLESHYCDQP